MITKSYAEPRSYSGAPDPYSAKLLLIISEGLQKHLKVHMLKTRLKPACFPLLPRLGNGTYFFRSPKHPRILCLIPMTGDPENPVPTKTTNNNNSGIHYFSASAC